MQRDGKVVEGGLFTAFNEVERNGLARLNGDGSPVRLGLPGWLPDGTFQMMFYGESGVQYVVEGSSNWVDWTSITNFTLSGNPRPVIDPESSARPTRFYRARSLPEGRE